MSDQHLPSVIAWELTDPLEKAIWGTTFAMKLAQFSPEEAAAIANEAVRFASFLVSGRSGAIDPALRAAHSAIEISRSDFEVWFRVELQLQAGRWHQYSTTVTKHEIDEAFERYSRGRSDYY